MFEKLKNKLKELQKSLKSKKEDLNLEQFNDPLAIEIDWLPLKPGGASFQTKTLKKISSTFYKFQMSTAAKIFIGIFASIGIGVLLVAIFISFDGDSSNMIFLGVFGLIFTIVSFILYKSMAHPVCIDTGLGMIWKGQNPPKLSGNQQLNSDLIYFNDIHAFQIISERIRTKNGSYLSYELNLVLENGQRVNVVDHGKQSQILIDADILSQLLSKPVWDVS